MSMLYLMSLHLLMQPLKHAKSIAVPFKRLKKFLAKVHWPLTFYLNGHMKIFPSQIIPFLPNEITTGHSWLKLLINE